MSEPRLSPLNERQLHLPRIADVIADRIRELIISGEIADGERLPRLETLIEQFGVSAPSMREALRILEAEGLIAVKRGNVGGAIVQRPNAKTAAYNLALVLGSRGVNVGDVADALAELEPLCTMFCARRGDRNERVLPDLRRLNDATRDALHSDELAFNEVASSFHAAVVRNCGNATLTLVVGALQSVWLTDVREWVASAIAHGTYFSVSERQETLEFHEQLADLIADGDEQRAYDVMRRHIDTRGVYANDADAERRVDARAVRYGSRTPGTPLMRPVV
jgi:DNA-binding FadR family transcriptional regulator